MLVWINGPFGGGKTQTAHELHRRWPGSVLCDPEHVGFGLHRMTPPALRGTSKTSPPGGKACTRSCRSPSPGTT
ncbi:hypothetical protein ACFQV2_27315 [Actinokineospora soli]|uniref:AAA domain-containing protein n=1 Tax=Actinokineospora soli TaxID=1048753 RepID=A0ABW2TUY3_9PSEU